MSRVWAVLAIAAALAGGVLWQLRPEAPFVAFVPLLALGTLLIWFEAPARWSGLMVLFFGLVLESPQDLPAAGQWVSPMQAVGRLYFSNLGTLLPLPLPFSVQDVLVVGGVAALAIRLVGEDIAPSPLVRPALLSLFAFAAALVFAGLWGVARGAHLQAAYWQVRQVAFFPFIALLFALAFSSRRDLGLAGVTVLLGAGAKALLAIFAKVLVFDPAGKWPQYLTTHGDSVSFVVALVLLFAVWSQRRSKATVAALLFGAALILVAVQINHRRIAWLSIGACALYAFAQLRGGGLKRSLLRFGFVAAPVFALYFAAGTQSDAKIFEPVRAFNSIDGKADSSTRWREVENYNLAQTVMKSPLFGLGLGHPYDEPQRGDDISDSFWLYRYIPHNGVLWLFQVGGLVGFAALWSPLIVCLFLAARLRDRGDGAFDRVLAMAAGAVAVAFAIQAFGDMGWHSWNTNHLLALALVAVGKRASAIAYPSPRPWLRVGFVPTLRKVAA